MGRNQFSEIKHSERNSYNRQTEINSCKHKSKSLVVIEGFALWEVTALKCNECNNILHDTITNN